MKARMHLPFDEAHLPFSSRGYGAMRPRLIALCTGILMMLWTPNSGAYESYHDPGSNDTGYCATCHPGFGGGRSDALHALHTGGSDSVTGECDLCHTGSGRDNPLTMWSTSDGQGGQGLGCAACHGRDYGDLIEQDYRGFSITGLPKNSAYGLRLHHQINGITICGSCHLDGPGNPPVADDGVPEPENVLYPPDVDPQLVHYYDNLADVSLGGAGVDMCLNEDSENDADAVGLDNDGDNLYDTNDPDCPIVCESDTDCDNGQFCDGSETCDIPSGVCQPGTPPCDPATETCDEVGDVCEPIGCQSDAECDNGAFCDGSETCDPVNDCQAGTPPVVDDGVGCTDDSCDEVNDVIVHTPNDGLCDNGAFCDGSETCDPVNDCQAGTPPCDVGVKVTRKVRLQRGEAIIVKRVVKNDGRSNDQTRPATVVGTQNGVELYRETIMVADPVGNGRTSWEFPALTLTDPGDILWTATILDDDPDEDTAMAVTGVQ
jgi:hypothetical protein